MDDIISRLEFKKSSFILIAVFSFPFLIATVKHGGATPYILLLLFGLILGWPAWRSLHSWERNLLFGFIIFFVLITLSLINTEDLREGIKKVERYAHFPLVIPMYLLLKRYGIETGRIFLSGIFVASVIMLVQTSYESLWLGINRPSGAYHPIILGDIAMLFAILIFSAIITIIKKWQYYLLAVIAICSLLLVSIMSSSRGAWILLPLMVIWLLWLKHNNLGKASLVSATIVMFFIFLVAQQVNLVNQRLGEAVFEYQSYMQGTAKPNSVGGARLEMWEDAVTIWKENPIIGSGIGDYGGDRLRIYGIEGLHVDRQFGHAHSIYFDVLASAGLLGLVSMLICVFFIPYRMFFYFGRTRKIPGFSFMRYQE